MATVIEVTNMVLLITSISLREIAVLAQGRLPLDVVSARTESSDIGRRNLGAGKLEFRLL